MKASSSTGLLFQAYVLFACGSFVFYQHKEEVGFCCPQCGAEVVRAKGFLEPLGIDSVHEIVRRDVNRIFLGRM